MCGLVGVAGNLFAKHVNAYKDLLRFDTVRGAHSTGIAAIGSDKTVEPEIIKSTLNGWDFLDMVKGVGAVVNPQAQILFGHNRHATKGKINKANAHPFYVNDSLVGMHNGTLEEFQCKKFIKDWSDFGTDSEAALNSFSVNGEIETLRELTGAWAFVWYNYLDNTLNFTRNDKRPLWLGIHKSGSTIFWSSELWMMKSAIARNECGLDEYTFHNVESCTLVSYNVPEKNNEAFVKPKVYKYKEKVVRPFQPTYPTPSAARPANMQALPNPETVRGIVAPGGDIIDISKYRQLEALVEILKPKAWKAGNEWVWRDEFGITIVDEGSLTTYVKGESCSTCGAHIDPAERWRVFPGKVFVCENCAEDADGVAEMLQEAGVQA